jgi:hypothetical protein
MWRLLIHGIGLLTGFIIFSLTIFENIWGWNSSNVVEVLIFSANYLGMVALWPPRDEHSSNFLQSIIIVLLLVLCLFASLQPIFILLAGTAMLLIKSISQRLTKRSRFALLIIACVHLFSFVTHNFALFPAWFCITYVLLIVLAGCSERVTFSEKAKKPEKSTPKASTENQQQPAANAGNEQQNDENTSGVFKEYYHQLSVIMSYQIALPREMWPYFGKIEEKTRAIIECMKDDERDIPHGTAFLNRYLPMLKNSLESFAALKQHQANSTQFQEANALTLQSLQEMSMAFSEMHQYLLDNNVDDLMADLKSMNQLIRAQGFELKK